MYLKLRALAGKYINSLRRRYNMIRQFLTKLRQTPARKILRHLSNKFFRRHKPLDGKPVFIIEISPRTLLKKGKTK